MNNNKILKYPNNKLIAGKAYWTTIHNIAARYPDNPTNEDRINARNFFNYLIDNFVCEDCINHAKEYVSIHEPDFTSKYTLSKYFCDFHNHVNKRLGKPIINCELILDNNITTVNHDVSTCTTCHLQGHVNLRDNYDDLKTSMRNLIFSLCKEANVPPPNIHFQPCPDNASTSCVIYDTSRMKDGVYFGETDMYINPYSASIRTVNHETKHYINLKKGGDLGEVEADNFAIKKINENFEFDNYKNELVVNNKLMMDEQSNSPPQLLEIKNDIIGKNSLRTSKTTYDYPTLDRVNSMLDSRLNSANDAERMLAAKRDDNGNIIENLTEDIREDNRNDFILSGLNSFFSLPANLVGVSPSALNMTYTGSFISNVLLYLIHSNFSSFGSSMVSGLAAVLLFGGSAFFKNSIASGDRMIIQGIVALFLMNGIGSLIPQKREVMAEGFRLFVEGVKEFDIEKIKQSFFFDDEAFIINKGVNGGGNGGKKNTLYKNDVSNAYATDTNKASANIDQTRNMQILSRMKYDAAKQAATPYLSGEKNSVSPNYLNSDLRGVADSYIKRRNIIGGASNGGDTLEGIDLNQLTNELNDISNVELDADTYEILRL